jgi:hypothetical protein
LLDEEDGVAYRIEADGSVVSGFSADGHVHGLSFGWRGASVEWRTGGINAKAQRRKVKDGKPRTW